MKEEKKRLKIAWLFPDILYLHGERGNILALERLGAMMGLETEVAKIDDGIQDFEPMDYHIIFCPPGEMVSMPGIIERLRPHREELENFIDSGRVLLVTGTSQCIFGGRTERSDGPDFDGLGIIDCDYRERKLVYGDDLCITTDYCEGYDQCFGVQIQMMDIASREKELGTIIYGFGNNEGSAEGIVKKNSIFTNLLGPALVLNPWLTVEMIKRAAAAGNIEISETDIDMDLEMKSLEVKKAFALNKKTNLKNRAVR